MSSASRKKKPAAEEGGAPGWMVTYGDMMSLLLTFFVLLLSFSTISQEDFEKAMMSLQGALGILPQYRTMVQINPIPKFSKETAEAIERLARELRRRLQVLGKEDEVDIKYDKQGGLKISLPSQILFDTAQASVKQEAYPFLADLAGLLADIPNAFVEIRGHTDSRPLISSARYRDNYDLSYARADAVTRYVVNTSGMPIERFEIIACGPGQPVATNDTPEGQQANRRVEIYIRGQLGEATTQTLQERLGALEAGVTER